MTFPVVAGKAGSSSVVNENYINVSYPSGIQAGDLLVMLIATDGTADVSNFPTGWESIANANGTPELNIRYKIADGTETGEFQLTIGSNEMHAWVIYRITGWHGTSLPTNGGSYAAGTSTTPNPLNCAPSWAAEDTLWISWLTWDQATISTPTQPTNYTMASEDWRAGNNVGGVGAAFATRELNVSSEDAGTWALSNSVAWKTGTLAIRPGAAAGQISRPSADSVDGAWTDQTGGTSLAAQLDESVASDSDYIQSELSPSNSACRIKMGAIGDPATSTGHQIKWRAGKDATGGQTMGVTIKLYQGGGDSLGAGTLIAQFTRANVDAMTAYTETLQGSEADAITNYGDLYVELIASAT